MSKLLTNYCSCVFQLKGRQGQAGQTKATSKSPYPICAKSVYQGRGKPGPGAMACRFTRRVLESYDTATLRGWLVFEGVASQREAAKLSKEEAAARIHDYLQSKQPKHAIKVARVQQRQAPPQQVWRAPGQGGPKPQLRAAARRSPQAKRRKPRQA